MNEKIYCGRTCTSMQFSVFLFIFYFFIINLIGSYRDFTFIDSVDGWWQHLYQGCLGRRYFTAPLQSPPPQHSPYLTTRFRLSCSLVYYHPAGSSSRVPICLSDIVGIGSSRGNLTQFKKNTKSLNILGAIDTQLCFHASDC